MKQPSIDWPKQVKLLIKKYHKYPHPLEAKNLYQMLVMVVLSAQTIDNVVIIIAPELFKAYSNMVKLSKAQPEDLYPLISKIRNYRHKASWLTQIFAFTLGLLQYYYSSSDAWLRCASISFLLGPYFLMA